MSAAVKIKRQEVRFQDEELSVIQQAATFKGLSVPDFLRFFSLEKARETLIEKQQFELSARDWNKLMDDLNHPPEPTDALIKLMRSEV